MHGLWAGLVTFFVAGVTVSAWSTVGKVAKLFEARAQGVLQRGGYGLPLLQAFCRSKKH